MLELPERFTSKYVVEDRGFETPCWLWSGVTDICGYGVYWFNGQNRKAHRYAYETVKRTVPVGLVLDHFVCDTRHCVNPDHVREASVRENTLRGASPAAENAAKVECKRGHPFDKENTGVNSLGARFCKECLRTRAERFNPASIPHGLYTGYSHYRCRCDLCRAAAAAYQRDWVQRKRERDLAKNA